MYRLARKNSMLAIIYGNERKGLIALEAFYERQSARIRSTARNDINNYKERAGDYSLDARCLEA